MKPAPETTSEIATLAADLLDGTAPYLAAVRRLSSLRHAVADNGRDEDFMIFLVIDSETDHLPPEHARAYCAPAWLAKCDEETNAVEAFYRESVREACERLVQRFALAPESQVAHASR
jgi:hypothetical protein